MAFGFHFLGVPFDGLAGALGEDSEQGHFGERHGVVEIGASARRPTEWTRGTVLLSIGSLSKLLGASEIRIGTCCASRCDRHCLPFLAGFIP